MANILVTGGAGYIGSHTCKALSRAGHRPISYDNLSRGHRSAVQWGPLVVGDLLDFEKLKKILIEQEIEAVIHFAAYAYVKESVENPEMYFENNVYGSLMLFEAMKEAGVQNIVFSSSCATYGESQTNLITETHSQMPINPYGLTKLMTERMLNKYHQLGELDYCALRYFNAAGADPDLDIGESHDPEPHLIPTFIQKVLHKEALPIFGDQYPTPDGTCIRDFIHVTDLAEAHVLTVEKLVKKTNQHQFYNLGTSQGYSLKEVAMTIGRMLNCDVELEMKEARAGDPARLVGDASRFHGEFLWHPKNSTLEKIVEDARAWTEHKQT